MSVELSSGGKSYTSVVSVSTAKSHLRVDHTDDDTLIGILVDAAGERAETHTKKQLCTATRIVRMRGFCDPLYRKPGTREIYLPFPPLSSITSITYLDANGDSQTWDAANYQADTKSIPGKIMPAEGVDYPTTASETYNTVTITYVCGMASTTDASTLVPATIRRAMMLDVGTMYEYREDIVAGVSITAMPIDHAVVNLLNRERVYKFF